MNKKLKTNKLKFLKFAGLLILMVILFKTDFANLSSALANVKTVPLLLILFMNIPKVMTSGYRWHILLKQVYIKRSLWSNIKLYYVGLMAGSITPGRVGEMYRLIRLKKEGHSQVMGAFITFLARFFDLSFVFFLSIPAVFYILKPAGINIRWSHTIFFAIGICIFIMYLGIFTFKKKLVYIIEKILTKTLKIKIDADKLNYNIKKLNFVIFFKTLLITTVLWTVHFYQIYLMGNMLGIEISYINMVFVMAFVSLIAAIPITVMGLGTRELAIINALAVWGVAREYSIALAILIYTMFIFNMVIAAVFWVLEHND